MGVRPLKILFLAPHPFFQDRGTPIADRAVLEALVERGHEVDLLVFPEGREIDLPGCTIHRVPRIRGIGPIRPGFSAGKLLYDVRMLRAAARLARERGYDLVHAVEESALIACWLQRRFGIPFVYDMDSSIPQQMTEKLAWLRPARPLLEAAMRPALRDSLAVIAVCRTLEEEVRRLAPLADVHRIEDFSLLDEAGETGAGGQEDGRAGGQEGAGPPDLDRAAGPIVLYAGNLEPYQGIDLLLRAFAVVARAETRAQLVLIGGRADDIARYRKRAARLGIESRAHFLGPSPIGSLRASLAQADVLVSPRIRGRNTPMKIYSYLDSGCALVATRLPVHTQVLDDEIALLAEPQPEVYAEAILALLRDPARRNALGRAAAERARRLYSRAAFRAKIDKLYGAIEERLSASSPASPSPSSPSSPSPLSPSPFPAPPGEQPGERRA
ncbi:MAG: glycosyltransferase family 4 protein [Candidatus Eisenbacteria bacterium]